MKRMTFAVAVLGVCMAQAAQAQTYPTKAITFVVPSAPGGTTDFTARILGTPLAAALGKPVVIDNKPGASGNIGTSIVAKAAPDGYTLLIQYSGYQVGNPHLFKGLTWVPIKDFVPVAMAIVAPHVAVVPASVPANNMKELAAYAKSKQGAMTYASSGIGSIQHIGNELFAQMVGAKMTHIPYKGSGPAVQDLIAGRVEMFVTTPPSVIGHVQAGKLKALAYTSKQRHPSLASVPTSAEAGMPGYEVESWFAVFAPAGTPPEIVAKLSGEIRKIVESADFKKKAEEQGAFAVYMDSKTLGAYVQKELDYWGNVIKTAGITGE